ncbi:MAG: hypothetical protein ABIN08_08810 [Caldimonas sp.]
MTLSCVLRKLLCRVLIGLLLVTQFMTASYACPRFSDVASGMTFEVIPTSEPASVDKAAAAMPADCDQLDPEAANICLEHCRQGQQRVDSTPAPVISAAVPTLLYFIPVPPVSSPEYGRPSSAVDRDVAAEHPPPHAILHCVFRI